jgi:hypothetical protein
VTAALYGNFEFEYRSTTDRALLRALSLSTGYNRRMMGSRSSTAISMVNLRQ